jgi:tetratricopeptide (TPR) repeat protein
LYRSKKYETMSMLRTASMTTVATTWRFVFLLSLFSQLQFSFSFTGSGWGQRRSGGTVRRQGEEAPSPPPPPPPKEKYAKAGSVSEEAYSVSPLESLEAEYWGSLGPDERRAEQKTLVGLAHLREGNFAESLEAFDEVVALKGPQAYVWQRGIPLYYLGEHEAAAEYFEQQARLYVGRFRDAPSSELLWAAAARAQLGDPKPMRFAEVAVDGESGEVLRESNPVLRAATRLFEVETAGPAELDALKGVAVLDGATGLDPLGRYFYGHFYGALWAESVRRDAARAAALYSRAVASPFGEPDDLFRRLAANHAAGMAAGAGGGAGGVPGGGGGAGGDAAAATADSELWVW